MCQSELEEGAEKLSTALSGQYIQTPLGRLIEMTAIVRQRRRDLLCTVARGLNPPETPPALKRMGLGLGLGSGFGAGHAAVGWRGVAADQRQLHLQLPAVFGLDYSDRQV